MPSGVEASLSKEVKEMAEEKGAKNVDDLLKQIEEFEKTLNGLGSNVASLKQKLVENKAKFGTDISKWPKEAK
jgi:hypothetical protein